MNLQTIAPHDPPYLTAELPEVGGELGPLPEHFVVDEVPLYLPSGSGEHLYVRVQKRSLNTTDLVRQIARTAGVRPQDIGYAGMKDKHAVTSQWLSLPRTAVPPDSWSLPEGAAVLEASYHNNKLRTGHQKGNRFRIRLVKVEAEGLRKAEEICAAIQRHGLVNYFGEQRFGHGGNNLMAALRFASEGARSRSPKARFHNKLYPSVLQAEVFNRYATARIERGLKSPLAGEVVRLSATHSFFQVEVPETEMPRWQTRDILPTGPIFGPRMRAASGPALELEESAQAALGLTPDMLASLGRMAQGTRRDLLVFPESLTVREVAPGELELEFELPSGSYATQLVRELTRAPRFGARGEA